MVCVTQLCPAPKVPKIARPSLFLSQWLADFAAQELPVESRDVGNGDVLGADGLASVGVAAIAKAQLVHLGYHGLGSAGQLAYGGGFRAPIASRRRDIAFGGENNAGF